MAVPEGSQQPKITLIGYDPTNLEEYSAENVDQLKPLLQKWPTVWINVDGLGSTDVISALGKMFGLHLLALEDVTHLGQRPKAEQYENNVFITTQMIHARAEGLETEQISIFIGKNFVLTFQERAGDCFDPVRKRLKAAGVPRQHFMHSDYLAYTLLDAIIDEYFPILEMFGDRLDLIEDQVVSHPERSVIGDTHQVKRELQQMRRNLWPMREMISNFSSTSFVDEKNRPYLRDCSDHVIQALDMLETFRERASGLVDIYLSSISAHMNEIMKVLTIIATIFMPLSFIASLYGMNFDTTSPWNMPELHWRYGYLYSLGLMALSIIAMLIYFRRKGWLGVVRQPEDKTDR
ncbi:MAG TPA: magnesium/cobalt transporter CorA [Patescibacteria group bacterium]|nr:magnesium/cobalt transporter CorA [Patescibacteria group bacterium]